MFKGMHPVFWIGLSIMYGLAIICWIWEIALPGSVFAAKINGAAAPFYYSGIFMLMAVNIFLAWLWYYVPEQIEKKKELQIKEGGKNVTG
ncbi:MAG: hypothetical protein ACOY46_00895 [Bacillota bacterium]